MGSRICLDVQEKDKSAALLEIEILFVDNTLYRR
jgi:hypothetical protein